MDPMRSFRARAALAVFVGALCGGPVAGQDGRPEAPDPVLRDYLSGNGLLARGLNDLAAKDYRRFLEEHPTHAKAASARYALAVALSRGKKPEAALEQLETIKGAEFEFAVEAGVLRAQCLLELERAAEASETLNSLLRAITEGAPTAQSSGRWHGHALGPDVAAMLVEARYRAKAFREVEAARAALESKWPESARRDRAEYFAGLALIALEKPAEASARLAGVAKQWPKSPLAAQAELLAAQCAHKGGNAAESERAYQAAIESGDAKLTPPALLGLASIRRGAGQRDEAKALLDRLLTEFKESDVATDARLERGRVYYDGGEFERAMRDFDRYASAKGSDAATAEFWRARCEVKQDKAGAAAARLGAALEGTVGADLKPLMMLDLASALLASGEDEKAGRVLEEFQTSFAEHPQRPDAVELLATVRHRRGDYAGSTELCREFLKRYGEHALRARVEFIAAENAFLSGDVAGARRGYEGFVAAHASDAMAPLAKFRLACAMHQAGGEDAAKAAPLFEAAAGRAKESAALRPALLYLGDLALRAGDWAKAERVLREFVAFGTDQAGADDALLKLGIALQRQGRHADAIAQYERLLADAPKSAHRGLASFERARALLALGKSAEAKEQFEALASGDDARIASMALVQLGVIASAAGDDAESSRLFERAAAAGDAESAPDALLGLGSALEARGEHAKAVEALDRLIREHPKSARVEEARARRALSQARQARDQGALADLDSALAARGLSAEIREALAFERAQCLRQLGRASEADDALRTVAEGARSPEVRISAALDRARALSEAKPPKFAEAFAVLQAVESAASETGVPAGLRESLEYQLAACEYHQGRHKEAAERFERFLEKHEGCALAPSARLLAGECRRQRKQFGRAATLFAKALEGDLSDGDRQTAILRLGECQAEVQDWAASEAAFDAYLKKFKDPPGEFWFQARFGKGWALENQSRYAEAREQYAKVTAAHQGPTAARAQFQIGECLFAEGKHEEAARELLRVDILYAYPEWSAAALYEAGRCFEALSNAAEARKQFEAVREKHAGTKWASMAGERLAAMDKPAATTPARGTRGTRSNRPE